MYKADRYSRGVSQQHSLDPQSENNSKLFRAQYLQIGQNPFTRKYDFFPNVRQNSQPYAYCKGLNIQNSFSEVDSIKHISKSRIRVKHNLSEQAIMIGQGARGINSHNYVQCYFKARNQQVSNLHLHTRSKGFKKTIEKKIGQKLIGEKAKWNKKSQNGNYISTRQSNEENRLNFLSLGHDDNDRPIMKTFKHFDEISQRFTIANNVDNKIVSQKYQVISLQGKRPYNEDRYIVKTTANGTFKRKVSLSLDTQPYDLYCIFDGHGGTACANFLRDHFEKYLDIFYQANGDPKSALFSTFARCESEFLAQCQLDLNAVVKSGACAIVSMVFENKIYIANLGDCRALFLSDKSMVCLTKDHKPRQNLQKMRIIQNGGKLYKSRNEKHHNIKVFRETRMIPGNLNVSRTIGDIQIKLRRYGGLPGMISAEPTITMISREEEGLLLLASDGLFEGVANETIANCYHRIIGQMNERIDAMKTFLDKIANLASQKSGDNITIIVVGLQN